MQMAKTAATMKNCEKIYPQVSCAFVGVSFFLLDDAKIMHWEAAAVKVSGNSPFQIKSSVLQL